MGQSKAEMDESTKRFLRTQLIWMGIYFGIAVAIAFLLPFPYSFIVLIGIIMGLAFWRRRRMLRQMGGTGSGGSFFGGGGMFGQRDSGISYYCMNCGTKHNQISCPKCGSKLKKAGF
ncbi:MAG TPA: hypothetical protein VNI77_00985 [Nitrososphaera sp.]|nr:hypothetical protein [Nitrososphaera sp.]